MATITSSKVKPEAVSRRSTLGWGLLVMGIWSLVYGLWFKNSYSIVLPK